jgi:hypothetical protein
MAMRMQWCNAGRIARWSASVASCKATRCHHQASAHAVLMPTAPVTVRRVMLTRFWLPSPAPAPLMPSFKMLEDVEPDDSEEGRVRPLPLLNDKAGRCIPRGTTLPEGKESAVELAEMPEL